MNNDKTTFVGLFYDGSYVEKETFEEIIRIKDTIAIMTKTLAYKHVTQYNNVYYYYQYVPIDDKSNKTDITIGNFSIIDIGPERGSYYSQGIKFKIKDLLRKTAIEFEIEYTGLPIFKNHVFPFLNSLNELGSYEGYKYFKKYKKTEEENDNLKKKIASLQKELENANIQNLKLESALENANSFKSDFLDMVSKNLTLLGYDIIEKKEADKE